MDQAAVRFAPRSVVREFDFANALDDRLPEISEDGERLRLEHRFVQHFPNDGEFDERAGSAFARHEAVGEANQFEQAVLPGVDADFDVDPFVRFSMR